MIIVLPLLVALIGGLMFIISSKPDLKEIGRLAFVAGLLAFLLSVHGWPVQVVPH